jgi:hypothetical protein
MNPKKDRSYKKMLVYCSCLQPQVPCTKNLLTNADFEQGLTSWDAYQQSVNVVQSPSGTNGNHLLRQCGWCFCAQTFKMLSNKLLTLRCLASKNANSPAFVSIRFLDAQRKLIIVTRQNIPRSVALVPLLLPRHQSVRNGLK